jgi:PAS domain S-box-containing protein/putative nucleotidyltransferase with HDIG domain
MNGHPLSRSLERLCDLCWLHAREAMCVTDCRSGLVVDINPQFEKLTGYSRCEVVGKPQSVLHPEGELERLQEAFESATDAGVPLEFHILRRDGHIVPIRTPVSSRFRVDGCTLILSILHDVSDMERRADGNEGERHALEAAQVAVLNGLQGIPSEEMLHRVCERITHRSTNVLAWIGIAKSDCRYKAEVVGAVGAALGHVKGAKIGWLGEGLDDDSPEGAVKRTSIARTPGDTETDDRFNGWRGRARQREIRSLVAVPFRFNGGRASLSVCSGKPRAFKCEIRDEIVQHAEQIGAALDAFGQKERLAAERELYRQAQQDFDDALLTTVDVLTRIMEARDSYTADHGNRVALIATGIAREMGWREEKIRGLRLAALIHDIGKISIPMEVLNKSGPLSDAEWLLAKEHPTTGYQILKDIPFAWPIAAIVHQHHERMDGSGYPLGLGGDQILAEAKVLAVADVVDAISCARPYRAALGMGAALLQIERDAGTLLDADVVHSCVSLIRNQRLIVSSY